MTENDNFHSTWKPEYAGLSMNDIKRKTKGDTMDTPDFQTIEVNGIKLEIDMRTARRIDTFKVGDRRF